MKWGSWCLSLSSSSSLPLPPPLPFLPPLLFLHLSSYSRHCQFLSPSPFTFTLFLNFLFSLVLLFPFLLFSGSSAPQPISFLFIINKPIPTFYTFLHSFPFPFSCPSITNLLSFKLLLLVKRKAAEMPELFYAPKQKACYISEVDIHGIQTTELPVLPAFIVWTFTRHFYFFVSFFCVWCCL